MRTSAHDERTTSSQSRRGQVRRQRIGRDARHPINQADEDGRKAFFRPRSPVGLFPWIARLQGSCPSCSPGRREAFGTADVCVLPDIGPHRCSADHWQPAGVALPKAIV